MAFSRHGWLRSLSGGRKFSAPRLYVRRCTVAAADGACLDSRRPGRLKRVAGDMGNTIFFHFLRFLFSLDELLLVKISW